MIVLITGSRKWKNVELINSILDQLLINAGYDLTIIHGFAPGTDTLAHRWAQATNRNYGRNLVKIDAYPANWTECSLYQCPPNHQIFRFDGSSYCPTAGHRRNQKMVDLNPEACMAFLLNGAANRGTTDCINRAKAADIPIYTYWD